MLGQLISKYRKTLVDLNNIHSGKKKFHLLIHYFDYCREVLYRFPPFSLAGDFLPVLVDIILKNDINFLSPDKLSSAKSVLIEAKHKWLRIAGNTITLTQVDKAIDILNMQLLKSNFYLGNLDEGLIVLKNILEDSEVRQNYPGVTDYETPVRSNLKYKARKSEDSKYSLVRSDTFREIKAFEILNEIKTEFERLNSFSDSNINVLLVEQDSVKEQETSGYLQGTILNLNCELTKSKEVKNPEIKFENITDIPEPVLKESLEDIKHSSISTIKNLGGNPGAYSIETSLKFENVKGIYKGKSFGLAAAVLITCNYFSYANKIIRYKISNAAAFTGAVESDGSVEEVNPASISGKISAAFFSWVRYCIVPSGNYNNALKTCDELREQYPSKQMEIIPVKNVSDVFDIPEVIKKEKISYKNYTGELFNRHKAAAISLIVIFTALLVFLLANQIIPGETKDLPKTSVENSYLIYAPDRDTNWIFQNRDFFKGDTVNFGDVAIGDFWNPRLIFINNSRNEEKFEVVLDGKDKEEFEITWLTSTEQLNAPASIKPDIPQMVSLKFLPYKSEGKKNAYIEFKSSSSGNIKKLILTGNAGRLKNGYSLGLLEIDDDLHFDASTNLLNDNFTMSFWVKPLEMPVVAKDLNRIFFAVDNKAQTNNKLHTSINKDTLWNVSIQPSKSREIPYQLITSKSKIKLNEWNFFALSYKDSIMSLVLNDEYVSKNIGLSALRKINDFIVFNNHISAIEKREYYKYNFPRYIDLVCIYNKGIEPEELIKRRFEQNPEKENGLLVSWDFDESNANQVFDKTSNDFWPKYYGGVNRVLDKPPVSVPVPKNFSEAKNHVLKRTKNGIARFNKSLFNSKFSFSIQCDFKIDSASYANIGKTGKQVVPFFINRGGLDYDLLFEEKIFAMYIMDNYRDFRERIEYDLYGKFNWNRLTLAYDMEKNRSYFYLNGEKILESGELPVTIDITENYMGISFGLYNYFANPRFYGPDTYIDNIKIYNRAISPGEVYGDSSEGLLAYWTFEKADNELVFDEVNNYPMILWQPCELVEEDIGK